ncbi:hypothetical protein SAMN05421766_10289 [Zobellia uliginosa]|uniref:Uncharacterized protein n=1 Tax=Zobellia uliginosa TaxID=143224 RepID=A0ABY1KL71_9FLAO|nr:hypothetical protein [Zobellia uliginosa]SIS47065.1 hypothetical protein SAMN05421766_10289 [Zobellia uliginosa]
MNEAVDRFSLFFKKDFKKKFLIFVSIPLLASAVFLVDFFLLPESSTTDSISSISIVTLPQSTGGTSVRSSRPSGYRYTTKTNLKFATSKTRIKSPEIQLTVSPIFKTVKTVSTPKKKIDIASGFSGLNQVLLILCNGSIIISILYTLLTKHITENARLNLLFSNLFLLAIWIYALILY